MYAPAPAIPALKLSVIGPLPPFCPFEVQIRLSPDAIPGPAQLHDDAGHTTDSRLLEPISATLTVVPPSEFALKLARRQYRPVATQLRP